MAACTCTVLARQCGSYSPGCIVHDRPAEVANAVDFTRALAGPVRLVEFGAGGAFRSRCVHGRGLAVPCAECADLAAGAAASSVPFEPGRFVHAVIAEDEGGNTVPFEARLRSTRHGRVTVVVQMKGGRHA